MVLVALMEATSFFKFIELGEMNKKDIANSRIKLLKNKIKLIIG